MPACHTVAVSDQSTPEQLALTSAPDQIEVEPSVLKWARESIGLDLERASRRIGVVKATIEKWEAGEASPSLPQLRKAAAAYKRPLAVLLLSRPAKDFDALRDFRVGSEGDAATPSSELTSEYWRALMQREVILEIGDLGALPEIELRDPAAITLDTPPEEAGSQIRRWVGIDARAWAEPRLALSGWIAATESQGILVMQTHRVSITEMRGFSVSEWPHPIIALNGSDFQRGRLFTLVHELAHLALNAGGLCDLHEDRKRDQAEDQIERYCNRVAAAALMPRAALMEAASVVRAQPERRWTPDDLEALARPFGTSAESMLLRLVTLDKATWNLYWELKPQFEQYYAAAKDTQKQSEGGPSFYVVKARDLGPGYVRIVLDAFRGHAISSLDVADYLDVRFDQIPKLEDATR